MALDIRKEINDLGETLDPRRVASGIWRYRWVVLLSMLAGFVIVSGWLLQTPRVYESEVVLEYDPNPRSPLGNKFDDSSGVGQFLMSREFFETQNRIIASRSVAERVVERLGARGILGQTEGKDDKDIDKEALAQLIQSKIVVDPIEDTRLVRVRVRDKDPERAAQLANVLAEVYINKTLEDRMGSSVEAGDWLTQRLRSSQAQLQQSELALHSFKEGNNVLSVSMEERQNLIGEEIQSYSEKLNEARAKRIELQAKLERLRLASRATDSDVSFESSEDEGQLDKLRGAINEKKTERAALAGRYGSAHPELQRIDREIEALRKSLREELKDRIVATSSMVAEAGSLEKGFYDALDKAQKRGLDLNLREIDYSRLLRQRDNDSKIYEMLLNRSAETDLSRLMTTANVRIVDRALVPDHPVFPIVSLTLAIGVIVGLVIGAILAFVLYRFDRKVRFIEEVESLGLPVVGVLPSIDLDESIVSTRDRKKVRARDSEGSFVQMERLLEYYPMSSTAEAFRTARTNLLFASAEAPLDVLLITSPNPREGKTTIASNLAISFAQNGQKVLLIDSDLRRPRIEDVYHLGSAHGVSDYLFHNLSLDEVAYRTSVPNLDVVPAGTPMPNPAELLHSKRFAQFLQEARGRYDRVLIDSPPIFAVSDAAVIAPQCSGALIVVRADQTPRDSIAYLIRVLRATNVRLVGAIINDLSRERSVYGSSDYYSYGYTEEERASLSSSAPGSLSAA